MDTKHLFVLSALALSITSTATAENHEHRQHDAHQHGVVEWHIAQDGNELLAEITAPGSDVVGFEHAPENAEQKAALDSVIASLTTPGALLAMNVEAECKLEAQTVNHTLKDDEHHEDHEHHDEHKDHDNHDGHEHHDEHKDHDHHDGHEHHDGHDKKAQHGEFSAQYTFHCDSPAELASITTTWFEVFGNTEKISVQAISDKGVVASELTPSSNTFRF